MKQKRPKPAVDEELLKDFRGPGWCALCGIWFAKLDPHHWFFKRWCRRVTRLNLVSLCRLCHGKAESGPEVQEIKAKLAAIVAKRERMETEALEAELTRIKWEKPGE